MASLIKRFKGFFQGVGSSEGGALDPYGFINLLPGTTYDFKTSAGDLWANSVVLASINFIATQFIEANLGVGELRNGMPNGPFNPNSPVCELIAHPNEDYGSEFLFSGAILSLICDGNAYFRKVRSGSGKVVQLWWVPSKQIGPVWDKEGNHFITGYVMRADGKKVVLPKEDVIHLRWHTPDPGNYRLGLSPLSAAYREICLINEITTYEASILRNAGVPGMIASPKELRDSGGNLVRITREQARSLDQSFRNKFTGDQRGSLLVSDLPIDFSSIGFTPKDLSVDEMADRPEATICAVLGLPPASLGFLVGLKHMTAKASYAESRKAAYEGAVIPLQDRIASQLTSSLRADFSELSSGKNILGWDRANVSILADSASEMFDRAQVANATGCVTVNEIRAMMGFDPIVGGDSLDTGSVQPTPDEEEEDEEE